MQIERELPHRLPEADDRRDGRQEPDRGRPGTRTWPRPPSGWPARRSACPGRSARPAPGCTSSARCTTSSSTRWPSGPGRWWSASRPRAAPTSGPVIDAEAVQRFTDAVEHARKNGRGGGRRRGRPGRRGPRPRATTSRRPWSPTLPTDDRLFADELFVPLVAVAPVDSLDEAIDAGQRHPPRPDRRVLLRRSTPRSTGSSTRVEAGVVYVNRPAGATTGAWPGVQPFGGWKGSGSAGKAGGGLYYVQQYLREQSRTVVTQ